MRICTEYVLVHDVPVPLPPDHLVDLLPQPLLLLVPLPLDVPLPRLDARDELPDEPPRTSRVKVIQTEGVKEGAGDLGGEEKTMDGKGSRLIASRAEEKGLEVVDLFNFGAGGLYNFLCCLKLSLKNISGCNEHVLFQIPGCCCIL